MVIDTSIGVACFNLEMLKLCSFSEIVLLAHCFISIRKFQDCEILFLNKSDFSIHGHEACVDITSNRRVEDSIKCILWVKCCLPLGCKLYM